MSSGVPLIPETAPFSTEQRAWLNGFLAGAFGPAGDGMPAGAESADAGPKKALTICYGTQTGNAEGCARQLAKQAAKVGIEAQIVDLDGFEPTQLVGVQHLALITSTYGDGEMPDNALAFWELLKADGAPQLPLQFAVFALGDMNYDATFCDAGKMFDARLAELGGTRLIERIDSDVDYDDPFAAWSERLLAELADGEPVAVIVADAPAVVATVSTGLGVGVPGQLFGKKNPFPGGMVSNQTLNGTGSAKDTRHVVISLAGSPLRYEVGDALGVMPQNGQQLVDALLTACGFSGDEPVVVRGAPAVPIEQALRTRLEVGSVPRALLDEVATRNGKDSFMSLLNGEAPADLGSYLWGRDVLDVLTEFSTALQAQELVDLLKPMQPRLYSISSSQRANPDEVHLTVGVVRYNRGERVRYGACSGWLAGNFSGSRPVPVYVSPNKAFRLPADPSTPVIMVGPGTGIAPFRAFLQDRAATGAGGANWLFFGDQHATTDFLYREELETMVADGRLGRLDLAFSRDQKEKVYVQHRMRERGADLYAWLQEGAHFYVCGDATRMAKDVDAALHDVFRQHGDLDDDGAAAAVATLKKEKRYQRDVY